jgi:uncharacterized protein (TIGR03437 family)
MSRAALVVCLVCFLLPIRAGAARYAIFLDDEPAARTRVTEELRAKKIPITGSVQRLLNALFVDAPPERIPDLRALPGVSGVVRLGARCLQLNRAATLINAQTAWNLAGGVSNAGLGMKIGIIDSGIDQTHPAFQDATLASIPCATFANNNCAFTNSKVIVARSYIQQLGVGSTVNPATSRPDDFSPLDRAGHGTAVAMIAAGNTVSGPLGTITGIAPKAYLGSYKVRGTNGINEVVTDDVLILALEDALNDGMDVVNISAGSLPFAGPLDTGAVCGQASGVPCDPLAAAAESAIQQGMVVVAAAGDEGEAGEEFPTLATVTSPAYSPSVIAVAATSNSHTFSNGIQLNGSSPQDFAAVFGDGPLPSSAITEPVKDVASVGDAAACSSLPAASLSGDIAIAAQSSGYGCSWPNQVANVAAAGAVGVIFTLLSPATLTSPNGLTGTAIPSVAISLADGLTLRSQLMSSSTVTMDPTLLVATDATPNLVVGFSSNGPGLVSGSIKPEIAGVGAGVYTAAEDVDPSGDLFSLNRYAPASGTSFASPMAAGAAALVKQNYKGYTPAQIKSALVNTATGDAIDGALPASSLSVGAGRLNAGNAAAATVTVSPATIAFGPLTASSLPATVSLQFTNSGSSAVTLALSVSGNPQISLSQSTLTLAPAQSTPVSVTLSGSLPNPGEYEGQIAVTGAPTALHIPFQYLVGDGVPYNIAPLAGEDNTGTAGQTIPDGIIAFQVTDQFGVPVPNLAATFTAPAGATVSPATATTNIYGIAQASAAFATTPGSQIFIGSAGGLTYQFQNFARPQPTIAAGGVVDAASNTLGQGIAPGSYITIYGTNLSASTAAASTASLPPALDSVSVSFDLPSSNVSVVGHDVSVSPGQVNVQVPWELAGYSSVQMKINLDRSNGAVVTVPLNAYSPNFFPYANGLGAPRGQTISVFVNGLGPVSNQPASGAPALASPLSSTLTVPTVTVGGLPATVQFSGLAPGFAGLYQINLVVPSSAPTGMQPMTMNIGGVISNTAMLNVQ